MTNWNVRNYKNFARPRDRQVVTLSVISCHVADQNLLKVSLDALGLWVID